jgi:hypothetical protein
VPMNMVFLYNNETLYKSNTRLTLPSSSIPRLLNRVPALRQERRDIKVREEGRPDLVLLIGADDKGIVMVRTKPRIADVRIRDSSKSPRS